MDPLLRKRYESVLASQVRVSRAPRSLLKMVTRNILVRKLSIIGMELENNERLWQQ